jgi:hypothetical protein
MLPPEQRDRIYDFTFGDPIIHVTTKTQGPIICQASQAFERQRRRRFDQRLSHYPSMQIVWAHGEDLGLRKCKARKRSRTLLNFPKVCRQIYHETALRIFTHSTWHFDRHNFALKVGSIMPRLVPAQIRAITRIQIEESFTFPTSKTRNSFLRGLEHVEKHFIVRVDPGSARYDPLSEMKMFKNKGGVDWLKSIGLKSIHFTALAVGNRPTASTSSRPTKFTTSTTY